MFSLDKMNLYTDYEGPDEGVFSTIFYYYYYYLTF
jgi:hypothetical protein